jgi:UMF1 family MFS transporter
MALFIAANIAYQTGQVFYNAYLPDLAPAEEVGRLSGYGWAAA